MKKILSAMLLFSYAHASIDEVELKLNKPVITKRSARCQDGGVIKSDAITIYAEDIEYCKEGEHCIKASGHLLVKFNRYFFVGDSIYYNFDTKEGYIINGEGTTYNAIAGGRKIHLFADGSLRIEDAFLTPSPSYPPVFEATSSEVNISKKTKAVTKSMVGKLYGVPFMWLPSFGMVIDSKYKRPSGLSYKVRFFPVVVRDEHATKKFKQGTYWIPVFVGRYRMYDSDALQAYARIEYQAVPLNPERDSEVRANKGMKPQTYPWYAGFGGAIDFDYKSIVNNVSLQSRNFVNYGLWSLDPQPQILDLRYRVQGRYKGLSDDGSLETYVQWDKLSDRFLRSDFKVNLFDIGTLESNEAYLKYRTNPAYVTIIARPRLNQYRGFKQQLPTFNLAVVPIDLFGSKIYLEQSYNASFLRYAYSENVIKVFKADGTAITDFSSGRFSSILSMYRPFSLGPIVLTPRVGFDGIAYTDNQNNKDAYQAVCSYGGNLQFELAGDYTYFTHYVKPYATYNGLTQPTSTNNNGFTTSTANPNDNINYVFSIDDGYASYNQLIFGLNNEFYGKMFPIDEPTFKFNVSAMKFFASKSFVQPLSKGDIELMWQFPKVEFGGKFGWNFEKSVYDYIHATYGQTVNDYFAFSSTFRMRGDYWWRKDNHSNFIIDNYRTIDELRRTPLSNPRYCIVNKLQIQFSPLWTLQYENNIGQGQDVASPSNNIINPTDATVNNDTFYIQNMVSLSFTLSNTYRLKFNYHNTNSIKDKGFYFTLDLL